MSTLKHPGSKDYDRPYERCLREGAASLTDAQLLAVIIRSGVKGLDATKLAGKILELSPSKKGLLGLCHLSIEELMTVPGIGEVKAIQLKCVGELSKRIATYEARKKLEFSEPATIAEYYMEQLRHEEQETLIAVMLDTRNQFIGDKVMSKGTVNSAILSTRELFIEALRFHAVHIILLHNHPSGDPTPSNEDMVLTEKVYRAGKLLDISLMDHLVIGDRSYVSFAESGFIKKLEV